MTAGGFGTARIPSISIGDDMYVMYIWPKMHHIIAVKENNA